MSTSISICESAGDDQVAYLENESLFKSRRRKEPSRRRLNLWRKFLWKLVLFFMALFFLAAAYVQHNDPDPYLWMPVYFFPFLLNFFFIFHLPGLKTRFWTTFNIIIILHICYCFILGFWTIIHYSLTYHLEIKILTAYTSEPNMSLEEAKELLGLCLVIAWLAILYNGNFLRSGRRGIALGAILTGLPIFAWILVEKIECALD